MILNKYTFKIGTMGGVNQAVSIGPENFHISEKNMIKDFFGCFSIMIVECGTA